jgi:hypothetical protein
MKIRRLLEVDLARLAPLPPDEQRRRMTRLLGGGGRFSFQPTRAQLPDVMNVQAPMFSALGPPAATDFSAIEAILHRTCRSPEELLFNIQAARMLHSHFRALEIVSRPYDFGTLPLGLERGIQYWVPVYYGRGEVPVITFIDPRGGQGLTAQAREVVFSAMHAGIRERNPDFDNAILEIIQLPYVPRSRAATSKTRTRVLRIHTLSTPVMYSFNELDRMLTATLQLWDMVCAEAAAETRKRAGGTGTLL